jgi:hypothetical protein
VCCTQAPAWLSARFAPVVGVWIVLRRLAYLGRRDEPRNNAVRRRGRLPRRLLGHARSDRGRPADGGPDGRSRSHPRLREDSIIGTVAVALFATAIIISSQDSIGVDRSHVLFGSITTVTCG